MLLDHFSDAYHILSKKYSENLHFIIAGDANHLKLDPIITTLHTYYQRPVCLSQLDSDQDKIGQRSDHMIVVASPINSRFEQCGRKYRSVKYRPMTQSGLERMIHVIVYSLV